MEGNLLTDVHGAVYITCLFKSVAADLPEQAFLFALVLAVQCETGNTNKKYGESSCEQRIVRDHHSNIMCGQIRNEKRDENIFIPFK